MKAYLPTADTVVPAETQQGGSALAAHNDHDRCDREACAVLLFTFAVFIVLGCEHNLNLHTAAASNMISFLSARTGSGGKWLSQI